MTYAEMKGLGYGTVNERLGKVLMSHLPITSVANTAPSQAHAISFTLICLQCWLIA